MELSKEIIIEKILKYTSTVFFELCTNPVEAPDNYPFMYYDYTLERDSIFAEVYKIAAKNDTLVSLNGGSIAHSPYITICGKNEKDVNNTMELLVELIKQNPLYKDYYF